MNDFRCWTCHTETNLDGDCLNPECPTQRDMRWLTRLSDEQLRQMDRTLNRIVAEENAKGGARA